jgi:hypothetical protein
MSLNRKQRRAAKKKAKKSQTKEMAVVEDKLERMPTGCDECGTKFDRTDSSLWDSWRIAVYDDGPVNLICPACVPSEIREKGNNQ